MDLHHFRQAISSFTNEPWSAPLQLFKDSTLEVYYSPFEHINAHAQVVICGITPGKTQAMTANRIARDQLKAGASVTDAQRAAKQAASFDKLRANLSGLLDEVGLHHYLHIDSCQALFGHEADRVHYTSALRYPVILENGAGYNGTPHPEHHPYLRHLMDHCLAEEARQLPNSLWIPLGTGATKALAYLVKQGLLDAHRVLQGLPHPSGANAERIAYFLGRKPKALLSNKTNGDALDKVKAQLSAQIRDLPRQDH